MKLALLFALVAAAAVLSHSAPVLLDADATNSDTEQVDSMLTDLMAEVASKSTEDVEVGNSNVLSPPAARTEDIGNRHEEIHKSNGIIDLIDKVRTITPYIGLDERFFVKFPFLCL